MAAVVTRHSDPADLVRLGDGEVSVLECATVYGSTVVAPDGRWCSFDGPKWAWVREALAEVADPIG